MHAQTALAYPMSAILCSNLRRLLLLGAILVSVVGWESGKACGQNQLLRYEATEPHMGTRFTLVFYAPEPGIANQVQRAAFERVRELNEILSDYDEQSELSRLSASAPHSEPVGVSDDLWKVLERAQYWAQQSGGAFDVTIGPVSRLWRRARKLEELPAPDRLAAAQAAVGYQGLQLYPEKRQVRLTRPGMRLDVGGIAKGYAVDAALAVCTAQGIDRALMVGGGDVAATGPPPDEPGWRVSIADFDPQARPRGFFFLQHGAISTSGDAWQAAKIAGQRYSHIVDPRTGQGLTHRSSVSAAARRSMDADALATTLSILSAEEARNLVKQHPGTWMSGVYRVDDKTIEVTAGERPPEAPEPKAEEVEEAEDVEEAEAREPEAPGVKPPG